MKNSPSRQSLSANEGKLQSYSKSTPNYAVNTNNENAENGIVGFTSRNKSGVSTGSKTPPLSCRKLGLEKERNSRSRTENDGTSNVNNGIINTDKNKNGTVQHLRGWLVDFEKQNKAHYQKTKAVGREKRCETNRSGTDQPVASNNKRNSLPNKECSSQGDAQEVPTTPPVSRSLPAHNPSPAMTPSRLRFKPRIKKEEVEATNDSFASVQKLSEWLGDDPFEKRKARSIRKGMKVIAKSRVYEPDQVIPDFNQNNVKGGNVSDRKKWLAGAFGNDDPDQEKDAPDSVTDKAKWLENAFKRKKGIGINYCYTGTPRCYRNAEFANKEPVHSNPSSAENTLSEDTKQMDTSKADTGPTCSALEHLKSSTSVAKCQGSVSERKKWLTDVFKTEASARPDETGSKKSNYIQATGVTGVLGKLQGSSPDSPTTEESTSVFGSRRGVSSQNTGKRNSFIGETETHGVEMSFSDISDSSTTSNRMELGNMEESCSSIGDHSATGPKRRKISFEVARSSSFEQSESDLSECSSSSGSVKKALNKFDVVATTMSAVQQKRLALEKKEKAMKKLADPRANLLKTTWENASAPGSYSKKMVDAMTAKKDLSDLP